MFWVNGKVASTVSLFDRSFQYGDGCFTTILTKEARLQHWPLHVERMKACLDLLDIDNPDWLQVKKWLEKAALKKAVGGLKLHVSRGEGGRGYNPKGVGSPTVTISHFSFPEHYLDWRNKGIRLGVCQQKLGIVPILAGHKHNNRLEQVLLRGEMERNGFQDGVVCDINNNVIETTMANLFWIKGTTLYTAGMHACGVAGIVRSLVLQKAPAIGLNVCIGDFKLEHLKSSDEVLMTNSILGVAPVIAIDDAMGELPFQIGMITRRLQEDLNS